MALVVITIQDTGEDEADVSARFGPEVPTTDSGEVDLEAATNAQACGLVALAAIKDFDSE